LNPSFWGSTSFSSISFGTVQKIDHLPGTGNPTGAPGI
jgi:hypothetical protein